MDQTVTNGAAALFEASEQLPVQFKRRARQTAAFQHSYAPHRRRRKKRRAQFLLWTGGGNDRRREIRGAGLGGRGSSLALQNVARLKESFHC